MWKRKNDNAWTETDRSERQKMIATLLGFGGTLLAGIALLVWGIVGS